MVRTLEEQSKDTQSDTQTYHEIENLKELTSQVKYLSVRFIRVKI